MPPALSLPRGRTIQPVNSVDALVQALLPFMEEVHGGQLRGAPFEEAVLRAAARFPRAAACFAIDRATLRDTFGARPEVLYPPRHRVQWLCFEDRVRGATEDVAVASPEHLRALGELLHLAGSGLYTADEARARAPEPAQALLGRLLESGFFAPSEPVPYPPPAAPGIFRLQHASLLVRSGTTGILIDPHLHSGYEPAELRTNLAAAQLVGAVDAILLSHSHGDHFHLPTLLIFPRDTPIIVPQVPRATVLCDDLKARLEELGFTDVRAPAWSSDPVQIGDVAISALPFYGEQPLLRAPLARPDVRNWGNTYHIQTPSFSTWVLIDAGDEHGRAMAEVAVEVRRRFGPVDVLLSNLRRFGLIGPGYICGGHYWLTLTAEQIRGFPEQQGDQITLGPEGVAAACRISEAGIFLPYAHWWAELGERGAQEEGLVQELREHLAALRAPTRIVEWRVGDGFVFGPGAPAGARLGWDRLAAG